MENKNICYHPMMSSMISRIDSRNGFIATYTKKTCFVCREEWESPGQCYFPTPLPDLSWWPFTQINEKEHSPSPLWRRIYLKLKFALRIGR